MQLLFSPHNNFQDIDVFGGKNTVLIVLLVCFLLLIFVLISIGIIYRRRKQIFSSNVGSLELSSFHLENVDNDNDSDELNERFVSL